MPSAARRVGNPSKPLANRWLGHGSFAGGVRSAGHEPCLPPLETPHPSLGRYAMKSEAKTEPIFRELPGGSMMGCTPQVLGVEPLEFQAAVWTDDQPQT